MESRSDKQDANSKSLVLQKIMFLEEQLVSLDHSLPETYEYLIQELDVQRRALAELDVSETFREIDSHHFTD